MRISPTRVYTWVASLGLFLQGASTLLALLVPAVDHAFPSLLLETQMSYSHSLLHTASGLVGFATLRFGGSAGPRRFALWVGLFYLALGIVGPLSGHPLGIGLTLFDHYFHAVLGGLGLLAVVIENIRARAA